MKYVFSFCLLILSACGQAPSGSGPAIGSGGTGAPGSHTYTLVVSGDGVTFSANLFGDTQVNPGPTTVPAGQTVTYTVTGMTATSAITRVSGGGTTLTATLYKDAVAVVAPVGLYNPGDFHDFGSN